MLGSFSPGQTFAIGAVGGILVLCTIGFFILLTMMLGGDGTVEARVANTNNNNAAAAVNNNNQPNQPAVNPAANIRPIDDTDHIRGAEDAEVTIIEYSDFECPFCSQFHPTMQRIVDTYGDNVRWVYRHFPLTSIHPNATKFALATECAAEQGDFWGMADLIFENQSLGASDATLRTHANTLGLDAEALVSCVSSNKYADRIKTDSDEAVAAGGRGTPYSIIVNSDGAAAPLSGAQPYATVESAVKQFLQ